MNELAVIDKAPTGTFVTSASDLVDEESAARALAQCAEAQRLIPNASVEELIEIRGWARAVNAVAQAKATQKIAAEACLAQVMAERRLGLILQDRKTPKTLAERIRTTVTQNDLRSVEKLARIPDDLFESIIGQAVEVEKSSFSASSIYRACRIASLKKVQKGIFRAFDGSCYITLRHLDEAGGHWRRNLDEARDYIEEKTGLSKSDKSSKAERLDELHSRARQLAQAASLTRGNLSGEAARLVGEAELEIMKAAHLLSQAHSAQTLDDWNKEEA